MPRVRSKFYCFTLNNPTPDDILLLEIQYGDADSGRTGQCRYIVVGSETGENGTPHLQGYIEFADRLGPKDVKLLIGRRCHIEARRGTGPEAADYCKKDGNWLEFGKLAPGQGHRSDLDSVKAAIVAGASEKDIADNHFGLWCQYGRAFREYSGLVSERRSWPTKVYVLWGPTGTGKSRFAHWATKAEGYVLADKRGIWFDGYYGQDDVIVDDFDGTAADLTTWLNICDRYPFRAPIKGGFVNWKPRRMFFTSNKHPDEWFSHVTNVGQRAAWMRRINGIALVDGPLEWTEAGDLIGEPPLNIE